ncbi:hypothetical protein PCANC_19290 [Puccinia coronata f. sp. avenae]|uniref:Uncharacterized protein n=1 Tax=Puccinia coronata f. sp. avenae TaxID=200324 RepID=A0A2N5UBS4_9BASI|nr:hypothetical protein PCANC_19290 [Puccinia coronata f. sp. avenae]
MSSMESDPLFPPDFPVHLRRFTRHVNAVQTRGFDNSSTDLLFSHGSDHPPPPSKYEPAYDSYDLQLHPVRTFRPNRLIDNVERLFVSVVPLWKSGIHQVKRLTTWSDPNRTAIWAILYSLFWWHELVLPAALTLVICLSACPKSASSILFPPEKTTLSPASGDRTRNSHIHHHADPSSEEVAEVAAAAAATYLQNTNGHVPLPSPSTEEGNGLVDSFEKPISTSSKPKEPKAGKKNLSQQYKPVIHKYGGGIQNIAGDLCDIHERLRNLFARRFVPPPPRLRRSSATHNHNFEDVTPGMDANIRFALPFIPILFLTLILPTQILGRCVTFAIGFVFFLLDPIQSRSKLVRDALDPNQTVLRGVPTDRAFVLATLRNMQQRHDGGLDIAMKLLKKPNPPSLPHRKRPLDEGVVDSDAVSTLSSNHVSGSSPRSLFSTSKSGSSQLSRSSSSSVPPIELHQRLINFAKKINRVTERGTQILNQATLQSSQIMNGTRPRSVDLSLLVSNKSRKVASDENASSSTKSSSRHQAKTDKLLRAIEGSRPNHANNSSGTIIDESDFLSNSNSPFDPERNASSFFCYYGNMPGHLTIHFSRTPVSRPSLSFYSGLGQSFKVRKSLIVIPLAQIVAMRKVSMLSLAGVWGGIDGIEFYEKRSRDYSEESDIPGDPNTRNFKLKHHTFRNMTGRDEAFLKLLVLKDWDENEEPGWISV